jgi:hypothetical protein
MAFLFVVLAMLVLVGRALYTVAEAISSACWACG